jgi:hypothetical protein
MLIFIDTGGLKQLKEKGVDRCKVYMLPSI